MKGKHLRCAYIRRNLRYNKSHRLALCPLFHRLKRQVDAMDDRAIHGLASGFCPDDITDQMFTEAFAEIIRSLFGSELITLVRNAEKASRSTTTTNKEARLCNREGK